MSKWQDNKITAEEFSKAYAQLKAGNERQNTPPPHCENCSRPATKTNPLTQYIILSGNAEHYVGRRWICRLCID